jgi:hypothetical protein
VGKSSYRKLNSSNIQNEVKEDLLEIMNYFNPAYLLEGVTFLLTVAGDVTLILTLKKLFPEAGC